jgi:hypothetical protein
LKKKKTTYFGEINIFGLSKDQTFRIWSTFMNPEQFLLLGRVRILIKIRLKVNFDRFTIEKMSNFIFNRILMSIRTRP